MTTYDWQATEYRRISIPASIFGDTFGGYTLTDFNADTVISDGFLPATNESELMYVFSDPPVEELYWSLPVFPGITILLILH